MKLVIDACVLFPTILRGIVIGVAQSGAIDPVWSARILEEWSRAIARDGGDAGVDIALLRDRFPAAEIQPASQDDLWLPDENDIHVLAAAIASGAEGILTLNLKDFPTRVLSQHGILRRDPDGLLLEMFNADNQMVRGVVESVLSQARDAGAELSQRSLMKRARLPRLGKALFS